MYAVVSLTKQGQISIPAKMRKKLGWETESKVSVVQQGDSLIVKKPIDVLDLAGIFAQAGKKNKGKTPQQILQAEQTAIEEAIRERYLRKLSREK